MYYTYSPSLLTSKKGEPNPINLFLFLGLTLHMYTLALFSSLVLAFIINKLWFIKIYTPHFVRGVYHVYPAPLRGAGHTLRAIHPAG